jgi:hypothetical protein
MVPLVGAVSVERTSAYGEIERLAANSDDGCLPVTKDRVDKRVGIADTVASLGADPDQL